jgi:TonB family protein
LATRRNKWGARSVVAIVVALCVHVAAIALFQFFGNFGLLGQLAASTPAPSKASQNAAAQAEEDRPMEIETIVNQLDRPDEKSADELKREEQAKKEQEEKAPHGQVVEMARPTIEERPDKANFLSEYDSKVDRETKGPAGRDQAGGKVAFSPPVGDPSVREPQAATPGQLGHAEARPGRPGPLAMRETEKRHAQEKAGEGPQPTKDGELEKAGTPGNQSEAPTPPQRAAGENGSGADRATPASPSEGHAAQVPGLPGDRKPNLNATPDMLQRAIGKGAGSMDYLKDVDDGDSTALNSKKWKHAPFFNRVKRAVANEWHPEVVYVRHDPSGNVYGVKDRVTQLRVDLKPDGKLASWAVISSSGVDFLDDEAIDAFRKAAPFPNPPKELVEADGQIHFNFGFIFELSGRSSLKVFKYQ